MSTAAESSLLERLKKSIAWNKPVATRSEQNTLGRQPHLQWIVATADTVENDLRE